MIFEKIGVAQIDKDLQCLRIQIETKIYLIGLQDLQTLKENRIIQTSVFQITEAPVQQEASKEVDKIESKR